MKKKLLIAAISIIGITTIMIFTNPSKSDYINWAKEKGVSSANNDLEKGLVSIFGSAFLDNTTQSNNYIIFSTYKTGDYKTLGIFKNFISI